MADQIHNGDKILCRLKSMGGGVSIRKRKRERRERERQLLRNIKCCHKSKDKPEDRSSIFV